jgi:drug/metabolite transporter (DMT)-like permease
LVLGETLAWRHLAGLALILSGLALIQWRRRGV